MFRESRAPGGYNRWLVETALLDDSD